METLLADPRKKLPDYRYRIEVLRVTDGDSLKVKIDLGLHVEATTNLRLLGIDCPEINTQEGKESREAVVEWIAQAGRNITCETIKEDKYGNRWDVRVYLNGVSLAEMLVAAGHAVRKEYQVDE